MNMKCLHLLVVARNTQYRPCWVKYNFAPQGPHEFKMLEVGCLSVRVMAGLGSVAGLQAFSTAAVCACCGCVGVLEGEARVGLSTSP